MSSVRDIAKISGVSAATVSRVLNNDPRVSEDARRKVLEVANLSRYVANVGKRSNTNIAFVYTGESSLGSPFDAALMRGMASGMEEFGFDLMILDARRARERNEAYSSMFMRKGIRGAVLRTTAQTSSICRQIASEGFPSVVVGARIDEDGVSYIYSDSRKASERAVEHLIGLGHRRIAICLNIVDDSDHTDRLNGYRDALAAADIDFDERMLVRAPAEREGGAQLIRRLLSMSPRPTAVFITDPYTAIGALTEARRARVRVPGDLSVVGFDDAELRYAVYPEMTSVCQDGVAIGREAFSLLNEILAFRPLDRARDTEAPRTTGLEAIQRSMQTWFEVHDSTGRMEA
ncbi:MAG: hypothetical protein CMJ18_05485 [Phycisphaeraceae bacterium]|nr:hypothetical protein [Phycisphaeraceae bacterium]